MSYKEKEYRQRLSLGQRSNTLILLISINVILYIVFAFIYAFFYMQYKEGVDKCEDNIEDYVNADQ